LHKSFLAPAGRRLEVLRGVSFELAEGEALAVVGASGAGKSTLLHVIGGLEAAESGEVHVGDFNVVRARGAKLASFRAREIGFIFQFHHLLPDLTAVENVAMPLYINRKSRRESLQRALVALERIGLAERATHAVGQLSGGEQQRVAVARALISEPHLVLADEPTGNLDAETGNEIGAMLLDFCRERKASIVIATHNEKLASRCDRRLFLTEGKLKESPQRHRDTEKTKDEL
jgi:lipoprotein-releasing system ATP-binding protein